MDFVVTITDPAALAGITWARENHNAPIQTGEDGEPVTPPLATDQDYVQWVMAEAAASYAQQKRDSEWRTAYEAEQAGASR